MNKVYQVEISGCREHKLYSSLNKAFGATEREIKRPLTKEEKRYSRSEIKENYSSTDIFHESAFVCEVTIWEREVL